MMHGPQAASPLNLSGIFPSREQFLVLSASLGDGERALGAFAEWRRELDETKVFDREVYRLLPLLYHNLYRCGCDDPLMGRLKGVYRMNWVKTQTLFARMPPIVHALADAGFEPMLLKGALLGIQYYRNPALRPMMDLDLAVPSQDAWRAIAMLIEMGWKPHWKPTPELVRFRHAMPFYGPNGEEFDLHWRSLLEFTDAQADEEFRAHTAPFEFLDRRLRVPDATRTLFHTVMHGVRWNPEPPIRWIADAVSILQTSASEIDWNDMTEFAIRWKLTHRLYLGLDYLKRYFDAPVPDDVVARLARHRRTYVERIEAHALLCDACAVYGKGRRPVWLPVAGYVRFATARHPIRMMLDFSRFLRFDWGLDRRRQIPQHVFRSIRNRALRALHAS